MNLVVGATGFLGREICRRLEDRGEPVRALVRPGSPRRREVTGGRIEIVDGENMLLIATASEWVKKVLRDTPYADSIHAALRTLKGVTPAGKMRFHPGLVSHATRVPLSALSD